MASVKDILEAAKKSADWAIEREPANANYRASLFLAHLAGRLDECCPAIAAELDRVRTFDVAKAREQEP